MVFNKTEKINIGDGVGYLVKDFKIKQQIINYIYSIIDFKKYGCTVLSSQKELDYLKTNPHYVTVNFVGYDYLLVFKEIMGVYYSVLVDKEGMSNDSSNINYNSIRIISLHIRVCREAYNGTIFDGKVLKRNDGSIFIITECYLLNGINQTKENLKKKLGAIDKYLDTNYVPDRNMHVFDIKINRLYNYDELEELVYQKIPKSNFAINGIIFVPKKSGQQLMFIGGKGDSKRDSIYSDLQIKKTEITDVYDLYVSTNSGSLKRTGIACVPTIKCSHYCKKIFESKSKGPMIIHCEFSPKFKKWVPLKLVNGKKVPDNEMVINEKLSAVIR